MSSEQKIEKKINTVLVICNYRSASTTFTVLKAKEYDLPYTGEMLSHERAFEYGDIPAGKKAGKDFYEVCKPENYIKNIKAGVPVCFKIMPNHIRRDELLIEFAQSVDKLYYLYRRDWKRQVKSMIESRILGDYSKTGFRIVQAASYWDRIYQMHTGIHGEQLIGPYKNTIKGPDPETGHGMQFFNSMVELLTMNYEKMAELYKQVPGELICKEDYFSGEKEKPYYREITWENKSVWDHIPDFDVEGLFK